MVDLGGEVVVEDEGAGLLEGDGKAVEGGAANEGGVRQGGLEADVAGIGGEGGDGGGALVHLVSALHRRLHLSLFLSADACEVEW